MDDLISRQAVEDLIMETDPWWCEGTTRAILEGVKRLPTVDLVKYGKWIKMSDADGVYWACSECGKDITRVPHFNPQFDLFPTRKSINRTNYCPHCGVKMKEVKNE